MIIDPGGFSFQQSWVIVINHFSVEVEFEEKFQTMLARHKQELLDAG